jgi:hypothetical protein
MAGMWVEGFGFLGWFGDGPPTLATCCSTCGALLLGLELLSTQLGDGQTHGHTHTCSCCCTYAAMSVYGAASPAAVGLLCTSKTTAPTRSPAARPPTVPSQLPKPFCPRLPACRHPRCPPPSPATTPAAHGSPPSTTPPCPRPPPATDPSAWAACWASPAPRWACSPLSPPALPSTREPLSLHSVIAAADDGLLLLRLHT